MAHLIDGDASPSRACEVSFNTGEIFHIHELLDIATRPPIGSSVKILGYIQNVHHVSCRATLSLEDDSIEVLYDRIGVCLFL